jgi:hypothetical protein
MELVGMRRTVDTLARKIHKLDNVDSYLGKFLRHDNPPVLINLLGDADLTGGVALVSPSSYAQVERRFPGVLGKFPFQVQGRGPNDGIHLKLGDGTGFVRFDECLIVNTFRGAVRIRYMNLCIIVGKAKTEDEYQEYLRDKYTLTDATPAAAVRVFEGRVEEAIQMAARFANIFLMNKLHETTIGDYVDQHRDLILRGLGGTDLVSEPYLTWEIPSPDPKEEAINPDLFVRRKDGFWDVYDLKLPLLDTSKITKGPRRRRQFIAPVKEGIAQLAHYREFLEHGPHQEQAKRKYGVELNNPRFGLVVGNFENVDTTEIEEASRCYLDFELFDYDTLMQIYLAESGALPPSVFREAD